MPVGFVVVPGWYFTPAQNPLPMLPGGMMTTNFPGVFIMIVAGWVAFLGNPPL